MIIQEDQLSNIRKDNVGLAIGYTSGVFDLFHEGHENYLKECRKNCDLLIVGVDDDKLVKDRKGVQRPFQCQQLRMRNLERNADFIFLKTLPSEKYVKRLRPDVYFHSDENSLSAEKRQRILDDVRHPRIMSIPYMKDISTTRILQHQLSLCGHAHAFGTDQEAQPLLQAGLVKGCAR